MKRPGRRFFLYNFVGLVFVLYFAWRISEQATRIARQPCQGPGCQQSDHHLQMTTKQPCQDWDCWKSNHSVSKQDEWKLVCDETLNSSRSVQHQPYPKEHVDAPDDKEGYDQDMGVPSWSVIYSKHVGVEARGRFRPDGSTHTPKIAIIVPYRDRRVHLKIFLDYMHSFLQRQNANYVIYVVEMESAGLFRKGMLINAGFLEVMKRENTSCVIFHDVDMVPTDDCNVYYCDKTVRHYVGCRSPAIVMNFTLRFRSKERQKTGNGFFGGVAAFPVHLFRSVNGVTNLLSGWGGADDEIRRRIVSRNIPLTKLRLAQYGYYVLSHQRQPSLTNRQPMIQKAKNRMNKDGLSSVRYEVQVIEERKLFTWILIKTKPPSCYYPGFEEQYVNQTFKGFTYVDH